MAPPTLKRALRVMGWLAGALVSAIALILLTSWIGSSIPRNSRWVEPAAGEPGAVEIMVGTNGIHTELVLPLVSAAKDWRGDFPVTDIPASGEPYTHVAVSWGEREVFLNTPTWADLRPATALQAMIGGDALLHVAHYVRPEPGVDNRPLRLTAAQYARLVAQIRKAVRPPGRRIKHRGYADWGRVLRRARQLRLAPDLQPVDQRHAGSGRRENRLVDAARRRSDEMGAEA